MKNVHVRYGRAHILKDVSWTVRSGEHWALIGPNGAGKSTLLSLILGDNPQAYGQSLRLFGRPRGSGESVWDIKRRVGWIAPESQLYEEFAGDVLDALRAPTFPGQRPLGSRTARAWLRRLGLHRRANAPMRGLSEGQQRLVLLARILARRPDLLVLDEPCQGLDAGHRATFLRLLQQATKRGRLTMIYVTHERDELPASVTHRLALKAGRVASRR